MNLTLGEKLKDMRTERKMTSKQVCDEIKNQYGYSLSVGKYNEMESDVDKDFGYRAFIYLAKFYKVSTDYLLGLATEPSNDPDIQNACNVTGLSEEAIKKLKSEINLEDGFNIISILNIMLTNNNFWSMILNFSILEKYSQEHIKYKENLTLECMYNFSLKTGINIEEILKHVAKEFPISHENEKVCNYEEECDLARYKALSAVEKINDLFDHRCDYKYFSKDEIIKYLHLDRF